MANPFEVIGGIVVGGITGGAIGGAIDGAAGLAADFADIGDGGWAARGMGYGVWAGAPLGTYLIGEAVQAPYKQTSGNVTEKDL